MDGYLLTTDNSELPENKATVPISGYNSDRCLAFMRGGRDLYKQSLFLLAAKTMMNRRSSNSLMSMVPPEMSAMMNLHNQICSACRYKEGPLFTCSCCGIIQVCSNECLGEVNSKLSDHKITTHRFIEN